MKTSSISFGKVIAVSGKNSKVKRINDRLESRKKNGLVVMRDVTNHYRTAPSGYSLADAARKGDRIEIYITGDDIKKMNKDNSWKTIDGVLSHISSYCDLAQVTVNEAIEKIIKG